MPVSNSDGDSAAPVPIWSRRNSAQLSADRLDEVSDDQLRVARMSRISQVGGRASEMTKMAVKNHFTEVVSELSNMVFMPLKRFDNLNPAFCAHRRPAATCL